MAKEHLGFIGVGRMGGPMARRLIEAGYQLTIYDTNEAAMAPLCALGASRAASAAQVASAAEAVFASLPTPEIVAAVAEAVTGGNRIKTFVDLSTTGPRMSAAIAVRLGEHRIVTLDCPVSGGVAGAEKGTLAVMVSGPRETLDALRAPLEVFGKVFYVGDRPGLAQTMKLVNNLLSVAALAITSEGIVMGVKAGLDPLLMTEVINAGSGRNSATQDKFPKAIIPRRFNSGFATGLAYKDVKLCLEEAEALGVPMVVGNAVRQLLGIAKAMHGGDSDFTSIVRPVEAWAGVEVKRK
ncbi:MAG: NAD(P)-dependent oxidoreductase [Rhodospirillales bacterium]|nr:NAD(P)-dependent oxidoreductase [Rhodospirillales bacterium]